MSRTLVLALAPVVLIELGLLVSALVDLIRREPERVNGPKIVWGIVIFVINIIGPIAYFLFGRKG
ncbi:MAG: PLD nuclease N-terminal domain-containing protein [Symbiobacteriia bacterium]